MSVKQWIWTRMVARVCFWFNLFWCNFVSDSTRFSLTRNNYFVQFLENKSCPYIYSSSKRIRQVYVRASILHNTRLGANVFIGDSKRIKKWNDVKITVFVRNFLNEIFDSNRDTRSFLCCTPTASPMTTYSLRPCAISSHRPPWRIPLLFYRRARRASASIDFRSFRFRSTRRFRTKSSGCW